MLNILLYNYLIFSFSLLNLPVFEVGTVEYQNPLYIMEINVYEERNDSRFVSLFLFDCQSRDC